MLQKKFQMFYVLICKLLSEWESEWVCECACVQSVDGFHCINIALICSACDCFNKLRFYSTHLPHTTEVERKKKKLPLTQITNQLSIDFVVHRGRTIPTLASMQEPVAAVRYRQSKERSNMDLKSDDRGNFCFCFDDIFCFWCYYWLCNKFS